MAGMETFLQLVIDGQLAFDDFNVTDKPALSFRGLLIDVARRYVPLSTLMHVVDGLAATKMNVLQLHLSDYGAVRFAGDATRFPQLAPLVAAIRHYTSADITELISYATDRGVRVIPSMEIPDHASGFAPLAVKYCRPSVGTRLDGRDEATVAALTDLTQAWSKAFSQELVMALGGDVNGTIDCPAGVPDQLQEQLAEMVAIKFKKEAAVTAQPNISIPHYADLVFVANDTITTSLKNTRVVLAGPNRLSAAGDFLNLNSDYGSDDAPLSFERGTATLYNRTWALYDTLQANDANMVGASASFWTAMYCQTNECGAWDNGQLPAAFWMYPDDNDAYFERSLLATIFPRVTALGGVVWNYQNLSGTELQERIFQHNNRLTARGISTCPNGCLCNEMFACNQQRYSQQLPGEEKFGPGMILAISLTTIFAAFIVASLVQHMRAVRYYDREKTYLLGGALVQ